MEGAALAGAGQRDRPRKGGKRTKASKAQELFEEEVKRLVKLIDVKLTLQGLRNVVEYEEALKSALASSASGTYGGMLVDVYVGVVSGSSPEAVKLGYEHVRRKLRGPSSAHVMALFATEDSDEEESSSDEEVGLPSRDESRLNSSNGRNRRVPTRARGATPRSGTPRSSALLPTEVGWRPGDKAHGGLKGRGCRLEI